MKRLENKCVVLTGGAMGIGKAIAEMAAEEGAKVAVMDIVDEVGKKVVEEINRSGGSAHYWHLDVTDEGAVKGVLEEVYQHWGSIDVLVNNAGIAGVNVPTDQVTEDQWDQVMDVNVKGVFFCTKHVIPYMRNAGQGSIINLSSIYGLIGQADVPPYHASKWAVRGMTKTDALFYAPHKIRVNSVHPGYIWTPMVENHLNSMEGELEDLKKMLGESHPLGHMGVPEDIAYGVVYLASDESKFVTGSELVIDGGYTAQ